VVRRRGAVVEVTVVPSAVLVARWGAAAGLLASEDSAASVA